MKEGAGRLLQQNRHIPFPPIWDIDRSVHEGAGAQRKFRLGKPSVRRSSLTLARRSVQDSGEYSTLPVVLEHDLDVKHAGRVIATMVFELNGHSGG